MSTPAKPVVWTIHAEAALIERVIARDDVLFTRSNYEFRVPDTLPPNEVLMRRYVDPHLGKQVLQSSPEVSVNCSTSWLW